MAKSFVRVTFLWLGLMMFSSSCMVNGKNVADGYPQILGMLAIGIGYSFGSMAYERGQSILPAETAKIASQWQPIPTAEGVDVGMDYRF